MTKKAIKKEIKKSSNIVSEEKHSITFDNAVQGGKDILHYVSDTIIKKSDSMKSFRKYVKNLDDFKLVIDQIKFDQNYAGLTDYQKLLFNNRVSYLKGLCSLKKTTIKKNDKPVKRVTDNLIDPIADNADLVNDIEAVAVEGNDTSKADRIATCNSVFAICQKKWNIPLIEVQAVFFDAMNPVG